jgi:hypothetical protein
LDNTFFRIFRIEIYHYAFCFRVDLPSHGQRLTFPQHLSASPITAACCLETPP